MSDSDGNGKQKSNPTSRLAQNLMLQTLDRLADRDDDLELKDYVKEQRRVMLRDRCPVWCPITRELNETQRAALMVPFAGPHHAMTRDQLLTLLAKRISKEIADDPKEAMRLVEMWSEHSPEFYHVRYLVDQKYWGDAIASTEGMLRLVGEIDWEQEQVEGLPEPISLAEVLELIA